jgi:hypothetical protein
LLHSGRDAASDQYLTVFGFGTESSGQVAHGADCGVAGALGKADLPQRRVALSDAHAKAQLPVTSTPGRNQPAGRLTHRDRHLDRALGRVGDGTGSLKNTMIPSPEN